MLRTMTLAALLASVSTLGVAATLGQAAPDFTLADVDGKIVRLSAFRGQTVVLEWTNPGCPFVQKHYRSNNMQALQREARAKGVVWLAVNSTTKSHVDYLEPARLRAQMNAEWRASPSHLLMDERGTVGRSYEARTTPHMYVIDPAGTLVYVGAIDDKRSTRLEDVKIAKNHVRAALDDVLAGRPVGEPRTTPYGCSVKYQ